MIAPIHDAMTVIAVIPARYASVRFPGKMLANRTGKPLVQHVYERAVQAKKVDRVIVATDDHRIADAVRNFGGQVLMTKTDHPNGTSRIAEVAQSLEGSIFVNVQGDEPELEPHLIDTAVEKLLEDKDAAVSTVASPLSEHDDPANPNIVKVVLDQRSRALYFSRAAIPHHRDSSNSEIGATCDASASPRTSMLKHVGLYVYRKEFLPQYVALKPTPLERVEQLEQLRILEHGHKIAVAIVPCSNTGIDTPEQYEAFVQRYHGQ